MNIFSRLTVLSLEQATTLPYLTLHLAEEGMRVIRVENPPRARNSAACEERFARICSRRASQVGRG